MNAIIILATAVFALASRHAPCVDYSAVCVPAQAMKRGCHCALIRPGQEVSARRTLSSMFGRQKRDAYDDIRFSILQQNGVDELNRMFSPQESAAPALDNNVFSNINTQVHVSLMTVPKRLLHEVLDMQGDWLTEEARHKLAHCGVTKCEVKSDVKDLSQHPLTWKEQKCREDWLPSGLQKLLKNRDRILCRDRPVYRQDRKFRVNRAVRYDMDGDDTLIAFASATSDFHLNKKLVSHTQHICSKSGFFKKKCREELKHSEEYREFDDSTKERWMEHVNGHMVSNFRTHNANLLQ